MQWQDEGIVIGVRRHGETSVVAELMTRERGRHLGLVRGGRSRTMQPVLQPGNRVEAVWRARLDEHLGDYKLEPLQLRAARLMEHATSVYGVQAMGRCCGFCRSAIRIRIFMRRWTSSSTIWMIRPAPANSSSALNWQFSTTSASDWILPNVRRPAGAMT